MRRMALARGLPCDNSVFSNVDRKYRKYPVELIYCYSWYKRGRTSMENSKRIHPIIEIRNDQKKGIKRGICSVCSANAYAIEAALENGKRNDSYVLIEATANQVNQFGGYTGMTPKDFIAFIYEITKKVGFDKEKLILGGDHLGPLIWQNEKEKDAMEKAIALVASFVEAGFSKIHIDTSMKLADDDPNIPLSKNVVAKRGAVLAKTCEETYRQIRNNDTMFPVYVIGSEVPVPGGAQEEELSLSVTKSDDLVDTIESFSNNFFAMGLEDAWNRVIAVVVQPGVEFGDHQIFEYDREKAKELIATLDSYPNLLFEGHSTDYQRSEKLREMVEDSIAILKVGACFDICAS